MLELGGQRGGRSWIWIPVCPWTRNDVERHGARTAGCKTRAGSQDVASACVRQEPLGRCVSAVQCLMLCSDAL